MAFLDNGVIQGILIGPWNSVGHGLPILPVCYREKPTPRTLFWHDLVGTSRWKRLSNTTKAASTFANTPHTDSLRQALLSFYGDGAKRSYDILPKVIEFKLYDNTLVRLRHDFNAIDRSDFTFETCFTFEIPPFATRLSIIDKYAVVTDYRDVNPTNSTELRMALQTWLTIHGFQVHDEQTYRNLKFEVWPDEAPKSAYQLLFTDWDRT